LSKEKEGDKFLYRFLEIARVPLMDVSIVVQLLTPLPRKEIEGMTVPSSREGTKLLHKTAIHSRLTLLKSGL